MKMLEYLKRPIFVTPSELHSYGESYVGRRVIMFGYPQYIESETMPPRVYGGGRYIAYVENRQRDVYSLRDTKVSQAQTVVCKFTRDIEAMPEPPTVSSDQLVQIYGRVSTDKPEGKIYIKVQAFHYE